ncbi:MAG: CBS domain-containing protein [Deltaproteobacteria bacterium]|nr:CBS domain-containing protein [Myxococcales bacterium]MDP3219779.1 CBS domain-containing protein [Deltaproteobacteria bacterium]
MPSDTPGKTVEFRVGVRETLSGDGTVHRHLTVQCELRKATVDVAECTGCERHVETIPREDGHAGVVRCRLPDAVAAPEAAPALRTLVGEVMERDVVCVTADVRVEVIATMLREWSATGVPVVDAAGRPIGTISGANLTGGRLVGDVMTPLAFSIVEDIELVRAAAVMSGEGFHQLPVLLGDGSLAGLLSTCEVARRVELLE